MTRRKTVFLALLLGAAAAPIAAQNSASCNGYTVHRGENLWDIAGDKMDNPFKWTWIVSQNPFLQQKGRQFVSHNGQTVVMLQPNECLQGLDKAGNLLEPVTTNTTASAPPVLSYPGLEWLRSHWLWLVLLLAVAAALFGWFLLGSELKKDPVLDRDPVVPGGVNAETARQRFEQRGASQGFRIIEQVAGRGYGVMNVQYADGRDALRELNGHRLYRATVRHENGETEELYMLQGCGNELRPGAFERVIRYLPGRRFHFEADSTRELAPAEVVEPVQAPVTEPEPVIEPAPLPVETLPATIDSPEEPVKEGTVTIDFRRANGQHPTSVKVSGAIDLFTLVDGADGPTIRYRKAGIKLAVNPADEAK